MGLQSHFKHNILYIYKNKYTQRYQVNVNVVLYQVDVNVISS